jgi:hypothetical protein
VNNIEPGDKIDVYYKLVVADIVKSVISQHRELLHQELTNRAADPVVFKRRFRMLSQLADYESQIYKKIYSFQTNNVNDYIMATQEITKEIICVINRNG